MPITTRQKPSSQSRLLRSRRSDLIEWMDRPDCDPVRLHNTYRYFPVINRLISRWKGVYRRFIRPQLEPGIVFRLLDVGSGGGDITRNIHKWAKQDGFLLDVTGIDPDSRALEYANAASAAGPSAADLPTAGLPTAGLPAADLPSADLSSTVEPSHAAAGIRFLQTDTARLRQTDQIFDLVICNHVLHHLPENDIFGFLDDLASLATSRVICSDIERSAVGYALFSVATWPLFPNSYIRADGLISIRKSFRSNELRDILPPDWRVVRQFPYRLLAVLDKETSADSATGSTSAQNEAVPHQIKTTAPR